MILKRSKLFEKIIYKVIYDFLKIMIIFCFIPAVASASIGYDSYFKTITVQNEPEANITNIYNSIGNNSIISPVGDKVWLVNAGIYSKNSTIYINDTDVSELRLTGRTNKDRILFGYQEADKFRIHNVTITGWNGTTNIPATAGGIVLNNPELHDVIIRYSTKIEVYNGSSGDLSNISIKDSRDFVLANISNKKIYDIYIQDGVPTGLSAIYILDSKNLTVYNITVNKTLLTGLQCSNVRDSEFYNIKVSRAGNYLTPQTGYQGIVFSNGGNNYAHGLYINDTGWSSLCPTGNENGSHFKDIIIYNSGHNGLDMHPASNVLVENISIYNSVSNNILATAGYYQNKPGKNIIVRDAYLENGGVQMGVDVHNITFVNMTINKGGIKAFDMSDIKIMNTTIITPYGSKDFDNCISFTEVGNKTENGYIIDSTFYRLDSWIANNSKVINSKYTLLWGKDNLTIYYYPDILVKNSSEILITDSEISFTNNVNDSIKSINGYGDELIKFPTGSEGRTYLPDENRVNSPAIAKERYTKIDTNSQVFSHTATITTPDNRTVSLTGITPDSSWYRPDPNTPTYTITAIIPNTSSKSPQIIGFAPAEDNPFNPGETKNFRVWTDESLTEMSWYVDGSDSPVSKGFLNYTWPITEGNHTIKFVGSNVNGTVNKTWYLGGSYDEPLVPGGNPAQEIEFSPADSVLTKNVSETVDFSVSPDIFTTKEWYVDGDLVLNNTVSMSKRWSTSGTYNVTFSGSGSEDVLHTWTVNVIEEPKDDEVQNKSIITIAPEYQIIEPKKSFDLSIKVEPGIPISGTQLDFVFNSSKTSVNNVTEGDLLKQSGAYTIFSRGTIDNSAGTVKNIYGFILGTSNVSSPGTMATVNLTAGNRTGTANFSLSNVLISDANSKSVPYTVTNATVLIDTAPVMSPICYADSVDEKSILTFKVSAKDADGDKLILSASGLPGGASFNKTSGAFTWTPAVGQAGVYTLTFKVSDGYLTDSENVTVTVNKLNNPPVINSFEPLNGSSFSEGERIGISVKASDADGQALTYFIRIDGVTHSTDPAYIWETDYSTSGNHTIEVVVSDGTEEVKGQRIIYMSECHPRWDVNEDGVVNILDITSVSQMVGSTLSKPYPRYDVNQDGLVNIQDLTLVGNHFGEIVN